MMKRSKMEMDMENEIPIMKQTILVLASLGYCYFLVPKIPNGFLRSFFLIPTFYIFALLPWSFTSLFWRCVSSFFITWITSFKLILFCFSKGTLATSQTYLDFIIMAIFPLQIKHNSPPQNPSLYFDISIKLASLGLWLLFTISISIINVPQNVVLPFHILSIVTLFYIVFTSFLIFVRAMARFELVRLMNEPYFATSLQDFWGRRWNRMSSDILRLAIYSPTRDALIGKIGAGKAKMVGGITTLVVSGMMHELVFYYMTCGMKPSWEVTWFFVMHGLCMILETIWRSWARAQGWKPFNPIGSMVVTLGFAIVTSYWLLILPVWRSGNSNCVF